MEQKSKQITDTQDISSIESNIKSNNNEHNIQNTFKKSKLLNPKIDAVFQILFSKANPEITKSLLSAILNLEIANITNNTLELDLDKILNRTYPLDKIGVLDVRAKLNNDVEINLEMQMLNSDTLIERILWYWAKLYSSQLKSGNSYSLLHKTTEILIINENIPLLKNILRPLTKWQIREHEIFSEVLTDKLEIIIIELQKVKHSYQNNKDNKLLQWMMFLLNPESSEVLEIMDKNDDIKQAVNKLHEVSEEEVNQYLAELREKAIRDEQALYQTGERVGHENGLKQGKIEIAKKLLNLGMPAKQVSEVTGLLINEIEELFN